MSRKGKIEKKGEMGEKGEFDSSNETPFSASTYVQKSEIVINTLNPSQLKIFINDRKMEILSLLKENELTIKQISDKIEVNPGTIKRDMKDLVECKLAYQSKITKNEWGIKLIYYIATARKFIINLEF